MKPMDAHCDRPRGMLVACDVKFPDREPSSGQSCFSARCDNLTNTGSRSGCVSRFGAFDMVGNLWEWVADWDERGDGGCATYPAGEFGADITCFGDGTPNRFPGALMRGAGFNGDTMAGPFAVDASFLPSFSESHLGFRGVR